MRLVLFCFLVFLASADVYLHSVRGSNNRLDEANRERNNGNRMFNSQNNDRGGYNVGKLNYFTGEEVSVKWTNQHGCNGVAEECEINVQIMCDPLIRDGTTTSTIPTNDLNCINFDCDTDPKYGRHESVLYYKTLKKTERNKGLFTANQNLKGNDATHTRQNPGGTRRGLEVDEERDYAPYWHPTPWIDVALFTNNPGRCAEYKAKSENVVGRPHCWLPEDLIKYWNGLIPLTAPECDEVKMLKTQIATKKAEERSRLRAGRRALEGEDFNEVYAEVLLEERRRLNDDDNDNDAATNTTTTPEPVDLYLRAEWVVSAAHNTPAPDCFTSLETRANHLGLIGQKEQASYTLKIPNVLGANDTQSRCVLRTRYNITTAEFDGFDSKTTVGAGTTGALNSPKNKPNPNNDPSKVPIWAKYGLDYESVESQFENGANGKADSREYVLANNPQVDVVGSLENLGITNNFRVKAQLAVNTAQFGRTFEDRTHAFYINKRTADLEGKTIKLLTVSGKRGNIVQTFPGHEYFMDPQVLNVKQGQYVHIEWTGSNTNPNNNDGQGKQGTDRSNMVATAHVNYPEGETINEENLFIGSMLNNYPAYLEVPPGGLPNADLRNCGAAPRQVTTPMAGFNNEFLKSLATGRRNHKERLDMGNMEELDDAATSFAAEPQQAKITGCWSYMSTRNNNFSNRSQKGAICVGTGDFEQNDVGPTGSDVSTDTGSVSAGSGVMKSTVSVSIKTWADPTAVINGVVSNIVELSPLNIGEYMVDGKSADLEIPYQQHSMMTQNMYWRANSESEWVEVDSEFNYVDGAYTALNHAHTGGQFEVRESVDPGAVIAVLIGALAIFGAAGYVCYRKTYNPLGAPEEDPFFKD